MNNLICLPIGPSHELAGVPYLDQYWGEWALYEPFAQFLLSHVQNLNLQVHVAEQAAGGGSGSRRGGELAIDADGIAYIELTGTLMKHKSSMAAGTSMALARRAVRTAAASAEVRGILLIVDSPGGTLAGTPDLAADIRAAGNKKPIHSYIEDLGASAGYWLPSQAQRVSVNATGLVGSIGVFQVVEDWSKHAEQKGVTVHVVKFGAMKGATTPGTPVTDEQLAYLQQRIDSFGEDFVAAIAAGRKMSIERARELADGRVHKGKEAKALGLVDAVETIDEAVAALKAQITRSPARSHRMSEQAADTNQPKPATLHELRDACPGASSEFLLQQLEKNASLAGAMKAHLESLVAANQQLTSQRDDLQAKLTEAEKKLAAAKARGVAPLAGDADAESGSDPWDGLSANEFMRLKIDERVAKGLSRDRAAKSVFAAHPTLHAAVVSEANDRG